MTNQKIEDLERFIKDIEIANSCVDKNDDKSGNVNQLYQ